MGAKTSRKDPYFFIINPFAAENRGEKWADTPRFPDLSLIMLIDREDLKNVFDGTGVGIAF